MKKKIVAAMMTAMIAFSGMTVNAEEVKEGIVTFQFEDNEWLYLVDGVQDTAKVGFVEYDGSKFLVANGRVVLEKSGLVQDPDNEADWYYLSNGQVHVGYTGLAGYDGEWFYVEEGKLDTTMNAFVEYDDGKFLVAAGQLKREANGLVQNPNAMEEWYFLSNGQVQLDYFGLAEYDGAWFYLNYGMLRNNYTGYVDYNGGTFYVENGQMISDALEHPLYKKAKENCTTYAAEMETVKNYVNQYRAEVGAGEVVLDEKLSLAAAVRAQEMADYDYFEHARPDGTSCFTVLDEFGIDYRGAGENIAYGYRTAESVSDGWYHSKGHYQNMVDSSYGKLGVGVAADSNGRLYWVQLFTN